MTQSPLITNVSAAVAGAQDQAPPDQGQDPAAVNMAPSGPSYTTQAPPPDRQALRQDLTIRIMPSSPRKRLTSRRRRCPTTSSLLRPETATSGLPATGPGGQTGYYWVPGAWVEAPYMGALWTPGYWGFYGGRYLFYPGYWGLHIGFYGGINYGFGYVGFGYEGGYWNSGRFFYNRVYNHIRAEACITSITIAPMCTSPMVLAPAIVAEWRRPGPSAPSEGAAWHEPTAPRMSTQVQHAQAYQTNRGQLATHNNGQPRPRPSATGAGGHNVTPTVRAQSHSTGNGGGHR